MSASRRSPRLQLVLGPSERETLALLARRANEPEATAAARILCTALTAPPAPPCPPASSPAAEPADADALWLPPSNHSDAIGALRGRYPRELRHLTDELLADRAVAEQLAALTVWRAQLDGGEYGDPRMELAFAHELRSLGGWLQAIARRTR
ncbi:hypothetical protein Q5424_04765 [Conexibacter sp. JD483]|uniref:hypothetical protein n=1 Tax=unclassified Conexibacter TaxID=2627773 RepID=UPI0027257D82|nr:MULTISPECIES: hypothetical protein [unclassified Conexibacter]MDO8184644.1 hypothetical protein [Conexibacter sp. CPCC 205706]MDO8197950.1 hypothetical protein [Conexibacter sp. CPCC 205762]MDR9368380.1 hypothetical protein [Conexibacter sp. JD483]